MFAIGNIKIPNRVVAAPLAGVTDRAGRDMARCFGCGLAYTEMVSDMGLVYNTKRTLELAEVRDEPGLVAAQIFGAQPRAMARGAKILEELGARIIDINMGCPTPKIVRNGEGAALMKNPLLVRDLLRAVLDAVQVPVTVKVRKGWSEDQPNYLEIALLAEAEGVEAVAIHPRSREQFFSGHSDWAAIKTLKQHLRIPVIGNGDIWSAADARRMMDETGCDAVMIGRAAMGNPFIYRETVALIEHGLVLPSPTLEERLKAAQKHLDLAIHYKGEYVGVREMRKHFAWYCKGLRGATRVRGAINQAVTRDQLLTALNSLCQ
ncbi:MAG: tRNA dihydrouridine synthase DusB [Syntrophomonadaceae bacterium]|jgi:tRNA-dihydrouridine synthase B